MPIVRLDRHGDYHGRTSLHVDLQRALNSKASHLALSVVASLLGYFMFM